MGGILEVRAPFLLGIIDVIAVPSLALFFGTRIVRLGAGAAAKACQDSKKADNLAAGNCGFRIFFHSQKMLPKFTLAKALTRENKRPSIPGSTRSSLIAIALLPVTFRKS